jgi:hypothetical protein
MIREAMGRGVMEEARNLRENSVRRLNQIACFKVCCHTYRYHRYIRRVTALEVTDGETVHIMQA